jgi:uncharacterized OB-fold protein
VAPAPATLGSAAAAGDRCAACGSRLAGDQRYCLECGERRGAARFSPRPTHATSVTTTTREPRRAPRLSGGTTLIAGVGTLLLAMGIGVLIGRTGSPAGAQGNSKVQVVQVPGGSGAVSTASTPSSSSASGAGARNKPGKHKTSSRKSAPASTTHLSAANATQTVKNLPPPTVTVGAKGHGPGYTHGHFTGTFFGP